MQSTIILMSYINILIKSELTRFNKLIFSFHFCIAASEPISCSFLFVTTKCCLDIIIIIECQLISHVMNNKNNIKY